MVAAVGYTAVGFAAIGFAAVGFAAVGGGSNSASERSLLSRVRRASLSRNGNTTLMSSSLDPGSRYDTGANARDDRGIYRIGDTTQQ